MGIMVYSLSWVMLDFVHQPYVRLGGGEPQSFLGSGFGVIGFGVLEFSLVQPCLGFLVLSSFDKGWTGALYITNFSSRMHL